jgi:hypothetical protein
VRKSFEKVLNNETVAGVATARDDCAFDAELKMLLLPQAEPGEAESWQLQMNLCVFDFFVWKLIKEMNEMIERFFPQLDRDFARPQRQVVISGHRIPIFILAAMGENLVRF